MNAAHQVAPERFVDSSMTCKSAHPVERRCTDLYLEMAFAAFLIPRMAAVSFAIIMHGQLSRREGLLEGLMNFCGNTHFSPKPSFSLRRNG